MSQIKTIARATPDSRSQGLQQTPSGFSLPPDVTLFPNVHEILTRISLLALLHAKNLCCGLNRFLANPAHPHFFQMLDIQSSRDLDDFRESLRLLLHERKADNHHGCTFLDWLEHIAWLLGKSPLSRDPMNHIRANYSSHITFFGDYDNSKIPSTITKTEWLKPYLWGGLLKTHLLLEVIPAEEVAKLYHALLKSDQPASFSREFVHKTVLIGKYIKQIEKDWSSYKALSFSDSPQLCHGRETG